VYRLAVGRPSDEPIIPADLAAKVRAGDESARKSLGDWIVEQGDWRAPLVRMLRRRASDEEYDQAAYETDQERFWAKHADRLRITDDARLHRPVRPSIYDQIEHGSTFRQPRVVVSLSPHIGTAIDIGEWGWPQGLVLYLDEDGAGLSRSLGAECKFLASPYAALLTHLGVNVTEDMSLRSLADGLEAHRCGERIHSFSLGIGGSPKHVDAIHEVLRALPRLEVLELGYSDHILVRSFERTALPSLRKLVLDGVTSDRLSAVRDADLPTLRHLGLRCRDYQGTFEVLDPVFARRALPALEEVAFRSSHAACSDRFLAHLAKSKLLRHLRALDLYRVELGSGGARFLIENARRLRSVELSLEGIGAPVESFHELCRLYPKQCAEWMARGPGLP
jgi:hypothetical protein